MSRIEIRSHARRTRKIPTEDNRSHLSRLRELLLADFSALEGAMIQTNLTMDATSAYPFGPEEDFEDIDVDDPSIATDDNDQYWLIEHRNLPFPSYRTSDDPYLTVELRLRMKQADRLLHSIRSTIADESFQYSHVLRVAPRKSVKTRARTVINKLNTKIAIQSCAYKHCHSAMMRIDAEALATSGFQPLTRSDIKASTALIDPNVPSTSSMRLSWIWQVRAGRPLGLSDSLSECRTNEV
jgi:hypothetical protein